MAGERKHLEARVRAGVVRWYSDCDYYEHVANKHQGHSHDEYYGIMDESRVD
jgi:hypothetical protein